MGGGMGGRGGYPGAGGMPGTGGDFPGSAGMPPRSGEPNTGGSGRSGGGRTREGGGARDTTLAAPRRLVLAQTDSSLTIMRQGGASLTLFFDGRTVYLPDPRGEEEVQVSARWHAGRLQVRREATYQRVTRVVTESYELSKDGTRLTVRTRMSGDGQSQNRSPEIRRVYDRAAEPSPAPPPQPPPQAAAQRIGGR
jgi:hypothetical protein